MCAPCQQWLRQGVCACMDGWCCVQLFVMWRVWIGSKCSEVSVQAAACAVPPSCEGCTVCPDLCMHMVLQLRVLHVISRGVALARMLALC